MQNQPYNPLAGMSQGFDGWSGWQEDSEFAYYGTTCSCNPDINPSRELNELREMTYDPRHNTGDALGTSLQNLLPSRAPWGGLSTDAAPPYNGTTSHNWSIATGRTSSADILYYHPTATFNGTQALGGYGLTFNQVLNPASTYLLATGNLPGPVNLVPIPISQHPYTKGRPCKTNRPPVTVEISSQEALSPAMSLAYAKKKRWLEPAFADPDRHRETSKFTVRFAVVDYKSNERPRQCHEWSTGASVPVPQTWRGPEWPSQGSKPVSKLELAHRVAVELRCYMKQLADWGTPLKLCGHEVLFEHMSIITISFCTQGSVQPALAILPEYAYLYTG